MIKPIAAALILVAVVAIPSAAYDCAHKAERQAALDAGGARSVRVEAGSGELRIEGRNGQARVEARGTACASDADVLERMRITVTREGDVIVVKVEIPERPSSWGWNRKATLDLSVTLPSGMAVDANDGSGSAEIAHVGRLTIEDGSGELTVTDVAGDLVIEDGSGSIEVAGVTGNVRVSDGSGSIEVRDVGGSVTIEEDGSGSIDVTGVKGDFTVSPDGSGGIAHRQIAGQVRIPDRHHR